MLRGLVNDVPTLVLVLAVVGLTLGVVLLAVHIVRRAVPVTREGFDAEVSSQILGVVAALLGLLLGFVIVTEFQNVDDTRSSVSQEADAIAAIVRDSDAFPPAQRARVRAAADEYVSAVVDEEWPRMRDGHDSARAWTAVGGLFTALQRVDPSPGAATSFHEDAVRQLNEALDSRRDRLDAVDGGLDPLIAALILVGSIVLLGYGVLVGSTSTGFHMTGAAAMAILVGFSLVVLLNLSYPFSGDLAIEPDSFRDGVLAQFVRGLVTCGAC